ncbi:Histone cluster 1, H2bb [Aix galericulata]|nr:Histone cluster 1, H2bb [Aix galericulata]
MAKNSAPPPQGIEVTDPLHSLLGQQHGLDVGQHPALRDGDLAQQLVELLVVADGQLQVAGDDARLLVVAGRVARQLQDLGRQVLQHGRHVDGRSSPDSLGIVTFPQQPVHAAHGELQPGPRRARLGLGPDFTSLLPAAGHHSAVSAQNHGPRTPRKERRISVPSTQPFAFIPSLGGISPGDWLVPGTVRGANARADRAATNRHRGTAANQVTNRVARVRAAVFA